MAHDVPPLRGEVARRGEVAGFGSSGELRVRWAVGGHSPGSGCGHDDERVRRLVGFFPVWNFPQGFGTRAAGFRVGDPGNGWCA
jgi:hypothetical protein